MTEQYRTKVEAKANGAARYFTGMPCKYGHLCERFVSGACVECSHRDTKVWEKKNTERLKQYRAQWTSDNKDKRNLSHKKWANNHGKEWRRKWRKENIDHIRLLGRVNMHKRRKRLRNSKSHFTKSDIERILVAQRKRCAYCRCKLVKYCVDHIMPLTRGGSNEASNIQITCASCNAHKKSKDPIVFAQQVGMLV